MKIIFLQPCNSGSRLFNPGDVAFLPDTVAEALILSKTAELVASRAQGGLRLTVHADNAEELPNV